MRMTLDEQTAVLLLITVHVRFTALNKEVEYLSIPSKTSHSLKFYAN